MPLLKKAPEAAVPSAEAAAPKAEATAQAGTQTVTTPRRIGGTRKAGDKAEASMTKDDYWRNREERDIEKDHRISRQGMYQAAMQSVGILQLNTGNDLESYLALVRKTADEGLKYANEG